MGLSWKRGASCGVCILISNGLGKYSDLRAYALFGLSVYKSLLFILFNTQFKYLKGVNSILSFFKLGCYSLTFVIDGLETVLNTS